MIEVFKLDPKAILPTRHNPTDAAIDLYSLQDVDIYVGESKVIKTGIAIKIDKGFVGKIEDRSGLASKGLRTGGGVIDAGYNGDVSIVMHNFSARNDFNVKTTIGYISEEIKTFYRINKGDKIAQLLIYKVETGPVWEVKELWNSDRGEKGFGSSGK